MEAYLLYRQEAFSEKTRAFKARVDFRCCTSFLMTVSSSSFCKAASKNCLNMAVLKAEF